MHGLQNVHDSIIEFFAGPTSSHQHHPCSKQRTWWVPCLRCLDEQLHSYSWLHSLLPSTESSVRPAQRRATQGQRRHATQWCEREPRACPTPPSTVTGAPSCDPRSCMRVGFKTTTLRVQGWVTLATASTITITSTAAQCREAGPTERTLVGWMELPFAIR